MNRHDTIEEQAALWVMRREEPGWSSFDEAALDDWLDQSDLHKAAFWRLEHGWRRADRIASAGVGAPERKSPRQRTWRNAAMALAASMALVFALFSLQIVHLPAESGREVAVSQASTDIGGRKLVRFGDGTQVELNTATKIRAAMGEGRRVIWLDSGEAFFSVAKLNGMPFVVHSGDHAITVLGTKFSVHATGRTVDVAVAEGRVRLDDRGSGQPARSAVLTAGQVAVAGDNKTVIVSDQAALERHLAWRRGLLMFDDVTLADAASEFNRYNRKQLVIADSRSARIRIGGSFQAGNVEAFARLLHDAYGLKVRTMPDKISVSA